MARKSKLSDDPSIALRQLSQEMAKRSIVVTALARWQHQIMEFIHEEYIAPLRAENAELRAKIQELQDNGGH